MALAQRILFEGKRAEGREYKQNGNLRTARARKEVLVSSGAYNSPQLLQLSGVGPARSPEVARHRCRAGCAGVGNDLQDHLQVRLVTRCAQKVTLNDVVNHPVRRAMAGVRYALSRSGPLTIAAGTSGAFFKTNPRLASPDIQIHFIPFSTDKMGEKLHPFSGFTASVCQLAAREPRLAEDQKRRSLGAAGNPHQLSRDRNRPRRLRRRPLYPAQDSRGARDEAVQRRGSLSRREGCSDEDLLEFCRNTGSTVYHPTSTCRMGNDPLAVVDQRLRCAASRACVWSMPPSCPT